MHQAAIMLSVPLVVSLIPQQITALVGPSTNTVAVTEARSYVLRTLPQLEKFLTVNLNESDVREYLLIVNGSLRQAYVAYLNSYELGIVLGDNGELIYPGNYTRPTENLPQKEVGEQLNSLLNRFIYAAVG